MIRRQSNLRHSALILIFLNYDRGTAAKAGGSGFGLLAFAQQNPFAFQVKDDNQILLSNFECAL